MASSVGSSSGRYAASVTSSRSSASRRIRPDHEYVDGAGDDLFDHRSSLENGVFGVLCTLRKENNEARVRIRWVLLKVFLDAWQLFTTVVAPARQGWSISPNGPAWIVVSVLNFEWLSKQSYGVYLALLYTMVGLLAVHLGLCLWVAWCFKEQKFPVVWPLKVLRISSSVFFQAFDVAALNLLQLGITCRYTGKKEPHLHFDLFPEYSCSSTPQIIHAIVSGLCLGLFVAIALLTNMSEVEVNLLSRRPFALGHSGPVVMAFAIKVLLTLVHVFIGWRRVEACLYLGLSLAFAWQFLRWNPHLVIWVNYLRSGVAVMIVWCSAVLMLLVFHPGVGHDYMSTWADIMTWLMIAGVLPAFGIGALISWAVIRHMTVATLNDIKNAKPNAPLDDICQSMDDPRDVEVVARCSRVWKDRYTVDPMAVDKARQVIQAGVAMFPNSAYMILLQANFMIDVLGVSQNGSRRIEDARKLNPGLMCRFIMFIRQQQASQQQAAVSHSTGGTSMDLLAYVEYQRKQRMVVRLHREALQAMCNFWRSLDISRVSFTHLTKALGRIESSVTQAQTAYRVVLESYGNNPKLVRLYGRFLQTIKNDPWRASEYFTEADRLEEVQNGDSGGPLLPDGTPLGRMDEIATAVLVINAQGEVQMANRHAHILFGYKRGMLEGKPMATLLAPHFSRWLSDHLASLVDRTEPLVPTGDGDQASSGYSDTVVVGMHSDRLAFPVKLAMRKASGVGEDSTFIVMLDVVPPVKGVASLWVVQNGTVVACDPAFVMSFGWKPSDVNGSMLTAFMMLQQDQVAAHETGDTGVVTWQQQLTTPADIVARLLRSSASAGQAPDNGMSCLLKHKYHSTWVGCVASIFDTGLLDASVHEIKLRLVAGAGPGEMLVVNRKGAILHASSELAATLAGSAADSSGRRDGPNAVPFLKGSPGISSLRAAVLGAAVASSPLLMEQLAGFALCDFLESPWKDMHLKYLKATTTLSPPSRSLWTCRKEGSLGPTLELRTTVGRPLYMRVSVSTVDVDGEQNHVIVMARSSLEAAIGERRLRLQSTQEGIITAVEESPAAELLGLDCGKLPGRAVWDIMDWSSHTLSGSLPAEGPLMFSTVVKQGLLQPGHSWRVQVSAAATKEGSRAVSELMALARASMTKQAVMQVHVHLPAEAAGATNDSAKIYIDLWLLGSVSGVLEVDSVGRIRSVLEEQMRPAGLLFGIPTHSMIGRTLGEMVELPPGRVRPADLLYLHGAKKSSLKTTTAEASVKVGPIHVLQGIHQDGLPNPLDVQGVGKPGATQTCYIILRGHSSPLAPSAPAATAWQRKEPTPHQLPAGALGHRPAASMPPAALCSSSLKQPAVISAGPGGVQGGAVVEKGSSSGVVAISTPPPQPLQRRALGNSSGLIVEGAADAPLMVPAPPDGLETLATGLPVPVVAPLATKVPMLQQTGRDKLAELVRSVDDKRAGSSRASDLHIRRMASSGLKAGREQQMPTSGRDRTDVDDPPDSVAILAAAGLPGRPEMGGKASGGNLDGDGEYGMFPDACPVEVESVDDGDEKGGPGMASDDEKNRISTWVASQGAYYQNSVLADDPKSDDDAAVLLDLPKLDDVDLTTLLQKRTDHPPDEAPAKPHTDVKGTPGVGGGDWATRRTGQPAPPYPDDDAASEGGQSAMSAQSGDGGADYKRGKRFRKLMKLMDSGQTQQVQQRYRVHALATVALLAVVHIICFALTIQAIRSKRDSMLQLGRSGQAQRYMHQILTDVRSLDVISKSKAHPKLYNSTDATVFLARLGVAAEEIKIRFKEILDSHHSSSTNVRSLLFYSSRTVWAGKDSDGTDTYDNMTIWDFAVRFSTMAKEVHHHGNEWIQNRVDIADNTTAGQFLLKSGPDLWKASRQVLDALLYVAVDDARWVNNLQIVFLCVEGAAITSVAACYLAYLLKAVAAQRYKLYSIFMLIPLGLTRALASQNTNLIVDEADEDDSDDGEDKASSHADEPESVDVAAKQKRRAVFDAKEVAADHNGGAKVGRTAGSLTSPKSGEVTELIGRMNRSFRSRDGQQITSAADVTVKKRQEESAVTRIALRFRQLLDRRNFRIAPAPSASSDAKRQLRYDSHDTVLLLMPFILWSGLVVTTYTVVVTRMRGIVDVLAVHSVVNFMAARTYRAVFFSQELSVVEDSSLLGPRRAAVTAVWKIVRDAWYTLQLGKDAYRAIGPDTERFPLVKAGIAYSSPALTHIFYGNEQCHRVTASLLPCPGPEYRFYYAIRTGLDSMMHHFMMHIDALGSSKSSVPPGLGNENMDYIYNVGTKDLIEGTTEIQEAHLRTIMSLFDNLFVLHVILLIMFWVIFVGFLLLLLNPLLKTISRERRRIAELMAQLPLELDVERLVAKALGAASSNAADGTGGAGSAPAPGRSGGDAVIINGTSADQDTTDGVAKWKNIIRSASAQLLAKTQNNGSVHRKLP